MRKRICITTALVFALCSLGEHREASSAPKSPVAETPEKVALDEAQRLTFESSTKLREKKFDEAVALAERALAIREKVAADSVYVRMSLRHLAEVHDKAGNYARAVLPLERALVIDEKRGIKGFELKVSVEFLGRALAKAGLHERAIVMFQRAISIAHEVDGGKEGEHATSSLSLMATSFAALRRYQDAEAALLRAIKVVEAQDRQPGLPFPLLALGRLYHDQGLYTRAEPVLVRSLDVQVKSMGRQHAAEQLQKLASTRIALEDYEGARVLLDELLVSAKENGEDSMWFVLMLALRGSLDVRTGAYDRAEPLLDRAQSIVDKLVAKQTEDAPAVAVAIAGLRGRLSLRKGDLVRAEKLLMAEVEFVEKKRGPKDKSIADAAAELADLHRQAGRLEKADAFALRALTICDESLAPTHPDRAESRAVLGRIREVRGDVAGAKKLHEQALSMREQAFGPEHPYVGSSLEDLADLARRQGQTEQAEALYKRAVAIFEKTFGPDHEKVAVALEGLSSLYAGLKKLELAVRLSERAADIRERQASLIIAGGSDAQKRAFVASLRVGTDFVTSLHAQMAPSDEKAKRLALTTIFQRKGRVLDVMAGTSSALRKRLSPADAHLFDEVARARADVARLAMRGPAGAPLDEFRAELAQREEKARTLEEKLGGQSDVFRTEQIPVTVERVQAALPEGTALIELSVYVPRKAAEKGQSTRLGAPRIAAYVLDGAGKIGFVDLGENAPIEQAAITLRKSLSSPDNGDPKPLARALDEMVMQKVRPLLGGKTKLLISADGALSLVPFAALVAEDGRYLVEKFEMTYLTSGRDLLRLSRQNKASTSAAVVLANPAFGSRERGASALGLLEEGSSQAAGKNDGTGTRGFEKAYFEPLPATGTEARKLSALMPDASVLVDVEATETAVKKVHAPKMLHIATHGFFVSLGAKSMRTADPGERGLELDVDSDWLPDDPLLRSGIALAGANAKKGGAGEDGILTALEASSLDLQGTKLVVMSACETGIGDFMQGEGIYGLRRALFIAGAESLVASLWKVADEETQALMVAYYGRVLKGETRSGALRNVQTSMLAESATAHPYYWASFGMFGNSAAMGSDPVTSTRDTPKANNGASGATTKVTVGVRGCACDIAGDMNGENGWPIAIGAIGLSLAISRRRTAWISRSKIGDV
jgi:CHAT domain-containing protein/tetratricopeptide (TPR) repeat protein